MSTPVTDPYLRSTPHHMAAIWSCMAVISARSLSRKPPSFASCSRNLAWSASRFFSSFSTPWLCFLLSSLPSLSCVGTPCSFHCEYFSAAGPSLNIADGGTAHTSHFSNSFLALVNLFSNFVLAAAAAAACFAVRSRARTSGSSSFQRKPSGLSSSRTPSSGSVSSRTLSHSWRYSVLAPCAAAVAEILATQSSKAESTDGSSDAWLRTLSRRPLSRLSSSDDTLCLNHSGS
mmetsp:Transcript_42184/g.84543  ORF Transcript_42184/g.84543 Transcript_42184/m.84543 type:complete len:232 (+) Transcript_42184:150-845(+)